MKETRELLRSVQGAPWPLIYFSQHVSMPLAKWWYIDTRIGMANWHENEMELLWN